MNFPNNLKYTREHEWIRMEGNEAVIGITDFAQHELGDIVFVDIDTIGEALATGERFGTVEAVKTVSDLYMPVAGTVLKINEALVDSPQTVNQSPYDGGWMVRINVSDPAEINMLLSAEEYRKHTNS